jgi:hypothetical protein
MRMSMSVSTSMRRRNSYCILMLRLMLVLPLTLTPSSFLSDAKTVGSGIGALLVVAALTRLSGVVARRSLAAPPVLPIPGEPGTSARGMVHCRPSKSTGTCLSTLSPSVTSLLKLLHFQLHTLAVPLLLAAAAFALPDLKRCCARLASLLNLLTFRTPDGLSKLERDIACEALPAYSPVKQCFRVSPAQDQKRLRSGQCLPVYFGSVAPQRLCPVLQSFDSKLRRDTPGSETYRAIMT